MSITGMRRWMQGWFHYVVYLLAIIFVVGIIGLAVGGGRNQRAGSSQSGSPETPIAKVNGDQISRQTFDTAVENETKQYEQAGQQVGAFEQVQLRLSVLDRLVNQRIMVQAANSERVPVSKNDINKKVDEYVNQEIDTYRTAMLAKISGPKTDEALNKELAKRQNGLTVDKIRDDVRKSINRDAVRDQLLMQGLQKTIEAKVDSSENGLSASYDEVKLAQITVDSTKRPAPEAEKIARDLVQKIRAGEDFVKVASASSDDPYAKKGGDRGLFMGRAYMEPELAKVAFALKQGEVSDPIKMPQGYMIVRALEHKVNLPKDFSDPKKHKEYLDSYVEREKSAVVNTFFESARKSAKIEILDPEMKAHSVAKDLYSARSEAEMKANAVKSIAAYKTALSGVNGESSASARIYSQMVMLYSMLGAARPGDNAAAKQEATKYRVEAKNAITEALNYTESNQLRMMLAQMNIDSKEFDKALENLQLVSDNAYADPVQIHMQIMMLAEKIKGSSKATAIIAKEKKFIDDSNKQAKAQPPVTIPPK